MARFTLGLGALALAGGLVACGGVGRGHAAAETQGPAVPAPSTPVQKETASPSNPDSATLAEFNARLSNYVKVQRALLQEAPLKETANPAEINARQKALGTKLQAIRKDAKQGDIFTPPVAAMLKRLMYPELTGAEGRETKDELKEDSPTAVQLKVNAEYPSSQPLSTVPPNLLANLPQLPKDVEYRMVGKHLIMRDVDANIIVDYIFNAII